jgi:hypothetical protein
LLGHFGQVEATDGVDGRVDLRAIVHRFVAGFFSQAMVFSSEYSRVAASNGRQPDTQRFAKKRVARHRGEDSIGLGFREVWQLPPPKQSPRKYALREAVVNESWGQGKPYPEWVVRAHKAARHCRAATGPRGWRLPVTTAPAILGGLGGGECREKP